MRKIFTFLACAAALMSANAQNLTDYTVDPVQGTVTEFSSVTVKFDNAEELEFMDSEAVYVTYNGTPIDGVKAKNTSYGSNAMIVTIPEAATAAGVYKVTVPANTFTLYDAEYNPTDYDKLIELTYTIEGEIAEKLEYTVTPAEGDVTSLSKIDIAFDGNKYADMDINTKDDITVTKDGVAIDGVGANCSGAVLGITIPETSEPGKYVATVKAGAICLYNADYTELLDNPEDIVITYTIKEKAAAVVYDAKILKIKPAEGEIDMEMIQFESFTITTAEGMRPKDGAQIKFVSADGSYDETLILKYSFSNQLIAFVTKAPEKNGAYTLTIPKGSFGDAAWIADPETGHANDEIVLNYTVTGLADPVAGVQYDLVPTEIIPVPETTVNGLDVITIKFEEGIKVKSNAKAYVSCIEARYSTENDIVDKGNGVFEVVLNKPVTESGKYDIFIYRGLFGDAAYMEDNNTGHASSDIETIWNVVTAQSGPEIDIVPAKITPEPETTVGELSTITIEFDGDVEMIEDAIAIVEGYDVEYSAEISITSKGKGVFEVVLTEPIKENGEYGMYISAGTFGDAEYIADNATGHCSDDIEVAWKVDKTQGIDNVNDDNIDTADGVYNLHGVRVADTIDGLAPGIYVNGGKKVMVK